MGLVDWAQAPNEQHATRLWEHTALKQSIILEVSAKMKPAKTFVESFGQGEVMAWSMEEKALVAPYAVELRHFIRSLVRDRVLPDKESAEYVEGDPPPRARPGTTAGGKKSYPEQKLTAEEFESGVKVSDLPETIGKGIRKAKVVMEEPTSTANTEEEGALADPMVLEAEETYLQAFDLDSSHGDSAMREAGDDWLTGSKWTRRSRRALTKRSTWNKRRGSM
jgi:hypothetical protein